MKKILFCCVIILHVNFIHAEHSINAILGDISYQNKFGVLPDNRTNENLRIVTHLEYVEKLLRLKPLAGLSSQQIVNRLKILALLDNYIAAAKFPSNYDYPGVRKPCFIDKTGNICAVGYLIEKTMGRGIAEKISSKNQYKKIYEMDVATIALLKKWGLQNGLTLKECAMIQPTYGGSRPPDNIIYDTHIKTGYAISSGVISGANTEMNLLNISHLHSGSKTKKIAEYGLIFGTGQVLLGIFDIKHADYYYGINSNPNIKVIYRGQNNLSYANIALGSVTMLTSAYNLFFNKKVKEKKTMYGLFSYPNRSNSITMGVSVVKKF